MKIETMIYIYGSVCVSMIVFNIIYTLVLKGSDPRLKKRCEKLSALIHAQLYNIEQGESPDQAHFSWLSRKMKRLDNLIAFDRVLDALCREADKKAVYEYLFRIQPVILYLAVIYEKRDNMQAGYFSYFLARYSVKHRQPIDSLQNILLNYIRKDNLYCRINALDALYRFGSPEHIADAVRLQDDGKVYIHEKVLTEGLLSYTGRHGQLIDMLLEKFSSFSEHTRLAILNYIRFQTGDYKEEMLKILVDARQPKELRLSAIRYFGRYFYPPAAKELLSFAADKDPTHWEYTNVAVSSLSKYEGEEVIHILKEALHSENWYIRYSAAQALKAHHMEYSDLLDVITGSDRYAREMITWHLESQNFRKKEI